MIIEIRRFLDRPPFEPLRLSPHVIHTILKLKRADIRNPHVYPGRVFLSVCGLLGREHASTTSHASTADVREGRESDDPW
jgi:hypothetical protein